MAMLFRGNPRLCDGLQLHARFKSRAQSVVAKSTSRITRRAL